MDYNLVVFVLGFMIVKLEERIYKLEYLQKRGMENAKRN